MVVVEEEEEVVVGEVTEEMGAAVEEVVGPLRDGPTTVFLSLVKSFQDTNYCGKLTMAFLRFASHRILAGFERSYERSRRCLLCRYLQRWHWDG